MFQNVFKNGHNFQYWNSVFWYNSCSILKTFYGHLVLPTAWGREGGCLQCACQHVQSFISNVSHVSMCNVSMCKGERQNSFWFSQNLRIPAVKPVQKCMSNHVHVHLQQTFVAEIFSILQHNARKRLCSYSCQNVQSSLPWRWPCKFDIFASKSWGNHREDGTYHQRIGDAQGIEENWQVFTRVCTNCFP